MLPSFIARRWDGRQTLYWPRRKAIHYILLGPELFLSVVWPIGFDWCFSFAPDFSKLFACKSPFLIHRGGYHDLFVCP